VKRFWAGLGQALLAASPVLALAWLSWAEIGTGAIPRFALQAGALAAPLGVLAWFHQIYPDRSFVLLAIPPAALSVGLLWLDNLGPLLAAANAMIAVAAVGDLVSLPRASMLSVERSAGRIASLRKPHAVRLEARNLSAKRFDVVLRDGVPPGLSPRPAELRHRFTPRSRALFEYELLAHRRGAFTINEVFVRAGSRWGLWQRFLTFRTETTIHVYPDLRQLTQYVVLARLNRLNLLGVRRVRRPGQDNEFERLRDYATGDNYKHIDWRSTARRRKLTVKDFQQNQSQRLIFLLDCGRMMTNQAGGLSLLDHAFNSALLLSYVALSRGDAVGLIAFSDDIHAYVPARGGMHQMNRLLHALFDQFPRLVESRYDRAFLHLESHSRKRSLVVLITNLIDDVNRNQIESYLENIAGHHLPLGVLLRDRRVYQYAQAEAAVGGNLYRKAAAADILSWRQEVLADLQAKGVLTLDVFPEELTAPLVNRYLEIKARHLL
jgi:uncharacterized protein (DUF58 family)